MPEICPRYASDIPEICPRCARDMPKMCSRYTQDMPKIRSRYARDMSKICPRYAQDMPEICTRYAQDMHKICQRNMQKKSWGKMSWGKMSTIFTQVGAKCPWGILSWGILSFGAKCLGAKCLLADEHQLIILTTPLQVFATKSPAGVYLLPDVFCLPQPEDEHLQEKVHNTAWPHASHCHQSLCLAQGIFHPSCAAEKLQFFQGLDTGDLA